MCRLCFRIINYIFVVTSFFIFLSCGKQANKQAAAIIVKDDIGREISFEKKPERIISLAPNLTEILFSIGCGNKIVGVTSYCNYPPEARSIQKVADLLSVNYEALAAANPDVVFITIEGNPKETFDKITGMGLKVFVSNPRNLNGIIKTLNDFGKITGSEEGAQKETNRILSKIDTLKKRINPNKKPTALLLVSISPLMSVGQNTYLNEVLNLAGFVNISSTTVSNYPVLNREEVLTKNPDYIFVPNDLTSNPLEVLKAYPEWKILDATKKNNIKLINADIVQRPGSRVAEAVEELLNKISR
jgi:iron complex transport system substrate-binding protein